MTSVPLADRLELMERRMADMTAARAKAAAVAKAKPKPEKTGK